MTKFEDAEPAEPTHAVLVVTRSPGAVEMSRYLLGLGVVPIHAWSTRHAQALLGHLEVDLVVVDRELTVSEGRVPAPLAGDVPTVVLAPSPTGEQGNVIAAEEPFEVALAVQHRLRSVGHGLARWGPLALDRRRHQATWEARPLHLTPAQFRILAVLVHARGSVVSRARLCRQALDGPGPGSFERLDAHLRRIRKLVEPDPGRPRYLLTVRGAGIRLSEGAEAPHARPWVEGTGSVVGTSG